MAKWLDYRNPMTFRIGAALIAGMFIMIVSGLLLAPATVRKGEEHYKFLHCDKCRFEIPYSTVFAEKPCTRCKPPKGDFVATLESVKKIGGQPNPWTAFNAALFIESILLLAVVVFILYNPPRGENDVKYAIFNCRHCRRHLRYRVTSAGSFGQCPRCKQPLLFPKAEDMVLEGEEGEAEDIEENG